MHFDYTTPKGLKIIPSDEKTKGEGGGGVGGGESEKSTNIQKKNNQHSFYFNFYVLI